MSTRSDFLQSQFTGWTLKGPGQATGWPVATGDDLHSYSLQIQLWAAVYERMLALGGTNDLPRNPQYTDPVTNNTADISDDLMYIESTGGLTMWHLPGDSAHDEWNGDRDGGHEQRGGIYPGTVDNTLMYDHTPLEEWPTMRWVQYTVMRSYRALQVWLMGNCGNFVEWAPSATGGNGYDGWTAEDANGDPTTQPPPHYTLETWAEAAGIATSGSNVFTRKYPKEFRWMEPVTGEEIYGDGSRETVTKGTENTYTDGSPYQAGDLARWVGNNIEDDDTDTGTWASDGLGGTLWIEWPDFWVEGDGRVYRRNTANTAWEPAPAGSRPDTVTAYGYIQRGDYVTPTLLNELMRGIDVLRWTAHGFGFMGHDPEDPNDDTTALNHHSGAAGVVGANTENSDDITYAITAAEGAYGTNADTHDSTHLGVGPAASYEAYASYIGEYTETMATINRHRSWGATSGIPNGIPVPADPQYDPMPLACACDFMTWGDTITATPNAYSSIAFDANGDPVTEHHWRLWTTVGGTDHERYPGVFGSLSMPTAATTPSWVEGQSSYHWRGYLIAATYALLRWDVGMSFVAPLSFYAAT